MIPSAVEGTLRTTQLQTCHGLGCHPRGQVAQGLVQPGLEHLQEWGIHGFSGQHHQQVKRFILKQSCYIFRLST